ncbi:caspase family protein [Actinoplanes sp. DH11]|uniref:caspase family protein n=1 Tax=Actinoplanes sp. DH11 TaxID=2857011 RepID=UPI001E523D04|nr:caspase family protein [Actinoplanes sp. DH11]
MTSPARRALLVGVGTFSAGPDPGGEGPGGWHPLEYAAPRVREVADTLIDVGYRHDDVAVLVDPLFRELRDTAESLTYLRPEAEPVPAAVLIHLLSHGFRGAEAGGLYVAAADSQGARPGGALDVDALVRAIQNDPDGPKALIVLDVCDAGTAVQGQLLEWGTAGVPGEQRVWVIGACAPGEKAFQGRLSVAVAMVMRRLHDRRIAVDPAVEYLPVHVLSREVRRELNRLCADQGGFPQALLTTPIPAGSQDVVLPLLPNPRYEPGAATRYRLAGGPLLAFLDDVDQRHPAFDPIHYVGRATGRDLVAEPGRQSYFTGRARVLAEHTAWLDGDDGGILRVVTGRPGAGKSALLGVLVCALHPDLAEIRPEYTGTTGRHLPAERSMVAAVHARGRTLSEVVAAISAQLNLPGRPGNAADLIAALGAPGARPAGPAPVVVLDALDEALKPADLVDLLLVQLARLTGAGGRPRCRILVGTRPWAEFATLLDAAAEQGGLCDLDAEPITQVTEDVTHYLRLRIGDLPGCGPDRIRTMAGSIVGAGDGAPAGVGPFLVASLFAGHLRAHPNPADVLAQVPRDLSEVLELDLAQRRTDSWLRPVLAALAHAREPGLPPRLVGAIAPRFRQWRDREEPMELEDWRVENVLDKVRFYLRSTPGSDGITHYRLFHQALVDHLRSHPYDPAGRTR